MKHLALAVALALLAAIGIFVAQIGNYGNIEYVVKLESDAIVLTIPAELRGKKFAIDVDADGLDASGLCANVLGDKRCNTVVFKAFGDKKLQAVIKSEISDEYVSISNINKGTCRIKLFGPIK